jgi:hypothetical protein
MKYYNFKSLIISVFALLLLLLESNKLFSQAIFNPVGAGQWMLGGSSAAHTNVWSATNNVGATTEIKKIQGGLYSTQYFSEKSLRLSNLCIVFPTKFVQIGTTITHFGFDAYNQQKLGISVAKKLSETFSLGVQLNYVGTYIDGYGSTGNITLAAGILIKPISNIRLGFTLFNPTQNAYGDGIQEKIPSFAKLGCAYDLSDKITLHSEADQAVNQKLIMRGGVLYKIHPVFHLAIGAASNPVYYTAGATFLLKTLKIDFATSIHQVLGITPHLSLSLPIHK